jgi:hypothetical protein
MARIITYLLLALFFIFFGLATRYTSAFPAAIAVHLGDMCWASMAYFLIRFLFYQTPIYVTVVVSFIFCFGIEVSQLYQSDLINMLRETLMGGLILGRGFLWIDLVRYTVGILLAFVIDQFVVVKFRFFNRK